MTAINESTRRMVERIHKREILRVSAFGKDPTACHADLTNPTAELQTWPSTIADMDRSEQIRGFHGCSVIAGSPKLGKSMLALRSGLEAAREGWRVLYYDGENPDHLLARRVYNVLQALPPAWPEWMLDNFELWSLGNHMGLLDLAIHASEHFTELDDRLLIVIDSVNRLAKRMTQADSGPNYYFANLSAIVDWAATASKLSGGKLGFLLVSELNRKGQAVGLDIEYSAECLLNIREVPDRQDHVTLRLVSRNTPGGDLGEYVRCYGYCEFRPARLEVVREPEEPDPDEGDSGLSGELVF